MIDVLLVLTIVLLSIALSVAGYREGIRKGEYRMRRKMIEGVGPYDRESREQ